MASFQMALTSPYTSAAHAGALHTDLWKREPNLTLSGISLSEACLPQIWGGAGKFRV
jgi:hypothetical protein